MSAFKQLNWHKSDTGRREKFKYCKKYENPIISTMYKSLTNYALQHNNNNNNDRLTAFDPGQPG